MRRPRAPRGLVRRVRKAASVSKGSPAYRAFDRFRDQRGGRLAAAMTYSAFLSLFPLLVLALAVTAAVLGDSGVQTLNQHIEEQLPGITSRLNLDTMVDNAATVGLVSGVILLWAGLSWVNMARSSLRTIWGVEDMPGNFFSRKAIDLLALVGLGVTGAAVIGATTLTSSFASSVLQWMGIADYGVAKLLLQGLGLLLSLAAQTAMFAYLLAGIPRLQIPRRILIGTSVVAAVVFEVTKGLVTSYVTQVASKSLYGAFGIPVAILVWFNLTFQMLLGLAAWTAIRTEDAAAKRSG